MPPFVVTARMARAAAGCILVNLAAGAAVADLFFDGSWSSTGGAHDEPLWTLLASAVHDKGLACASLGQLAIPDPAADFPGRCQSKAAALGADAFEASADGSACYFQKCGTFSDLAFVDAPGVGRHVYSLLAGPFGRLTSADEGLGTDCTYLGSHDLTLPSSFLEVCSAQALAHGGDTFDVKVDLSKCYFKRCGSMADLKFTDKYGSYSSYSLLPQHHFDQIGWIPDGLGTDCTYLGSLELTDVVAQFPSACESRTFALGGDTFDAKPDGSKCYFKKCGAFSDIKLSDKYGAYKSFTRLGGRWSQITRSADGMASRCTSVGQHTLSDPATEFPQACMAKALAAGGDTFDVPAGRSRCLFKKCYSLEEVKFKADAGGGMDTFTLLAGGWSQLTDAAEGVGTDCVYLGSYELASASEFPSACQSKAVLLGGDTFDIKPDFSKCYFKKCTSFADLKFTDRFGPYHSYTLLFPRGGSGWGPCPEAGACVDFTLLFTGKLDGKLLPVGGAGETCDPDRDGQCFGGTARRATFVQQQREKHAVKNHSVFAVELGGGIFGGPLYGHEDYPVGMPETMLMNMVPYDFCLFSPRDFLIGKAPGAAEETAKSFQNRTCPFLLSNARLAGIWAPVNAQLQTWAVKETLDGGKIGLFGFMPHIANLGFGFGGSVVNIDENSLLEAIRARRFLGLTADISALEADMQAFGNNFPAYTPHHADVTVLSTLVPVDVLVAAEAARRAHPDLGPLVLLVGSRERPDQVTWLAEHGPFDIIVKEYGGTAGSGAVVVRNVVHNKDVYIVGDGTTFGMGTLAIRFVRGVGIVQADYRADMPLDSTVAPNAVAQAVMSDLYGRLRDRNSQPFGVITNPLVGGHRINEVPPSKNQCYYTECSAASVIGAALLWQARRAGYPALLSLSNLGGYRQTLTGTVGHPNYTDGTVFIGDCINTLKFQNPLNIFKILGKDLHEGIKAYMQVEERGFISAGVRAAFYEPCYDFVDHVAYPPGQVLPEAPGTSAELAACLADGSANVTDPTIVLIDVQVAHTDFDSCADWTNCPAQWRRLEKGTTYTVVSTDFLASTLTGFVPVSSALPTEAEALCNYIAATSPLEVEPWAEYRRRGAVRYETPEAGWADGARVVSVKGNEPLVEHAPTCPGGMFLGEQATACEQCPVGTKSIAEASRHKCDACDLGFYSDKLGQSACLACQEGRFSDSVGATACQPCPGGTFSDTGAIYCNQCKPGYAAPASRSSLCEACSIGRYAATWAAAACEPCPHDKVTRYPAGQNASDCLCREGSYRAGPAGSPCAPCPEGMECALGSVAPLASGEGDITPRLLEGYMAFPAAPLEAYECLSTEHCPGGAAGRCAARRDPASVACGRCVAGSFDDGGGCKECGPFSPLPLIILLVAMVVAVIGIVIVTNRDLMLLSHGSLDVVVTAGITVSSLQAFGTFGQLSIRWVEPVASVFKACGTFSFDTRYLRTDCIVASGPVASYAASPVLVFVCFFLIVLSVLVKRARRPDVDVFGEILNSAGTIGQALFISLVLMCLQPLICYSHPGGQGASVRASPSVLCFNSEEHSAMLAIGVVTFILLPLPLLAVVVAATAKYKMLTNGSSGLRFMRATRFLFLKFRPECYYYGCIMNGRSLAICLVPVVLRDLGQLQVFILVAILCFFMQVQQSVRPWRSMATNFMDGCLVIMMLLLVVGGVAPSSSLQLDQMQVACSVVVSGLGLLVVGSFGRSVFRHFHLRSFYDAFICHHKRDAAAQARLLKMCLDLRTGRVTFIDSDHLQDLDALFDIVKWKIGRLVVYLTVDTLTRPWCACEITTARGRKVPIWALRTRSYCDPQADQLTNLEDFIDFAGCNPTTYGIPMDAIQEALTWFVDSCPLITVNHANPMLERMQEAIDTMKHPSGRANITQSCMSGHLGSDGSHEDLVFISADGEDDEAAAAAYILQTLLRAKMFIMYAMTLTVMEDEGPTPLTPTPKESLASARALIVLLSAGSLRRSRQVRTIVDGMCRRQHHGGFIVVPVTAPDFRVPNEQALAELFTEELFEKWDMGKQQVVALFKLIACPLAWHESMEVLETHANGIMSRMPKTGFRMGQTSSEQFGLALSLGGKGRKRPKASDTGVAGDGSPRDLVESPAPAVGGQQDTLPRAPSGGEAHEADSEDDGDLRSV